MKIRVIIVTKEREYAKSFLEGAMSKRDVFDVDICASYEKLDHMLQHDQYDVALIDDDAVPYLDTSLVRLALLLWDQKQGVPINGVFLQRVRKYQRISSILSDIQGHYAVVAPEYYGNDKSARITAVWSPAGGTGKTTVALAYAASQAMNGKRATYLDLEYFSGTQALLERSGKSISTVFSQISSNLAMQMQSIRIEDESTSVYYFSPPANYDDMNELTTDDVLALVKAAAEGGEELVVDLSSICDGKTRAIFELVDRILLVVDDSAVAGAKLQQFMNQNNVYGTYLDKITLVANKGCSMTFPEGTDVVRLQKVHSAGPAGVYTTLSAKRF